MSSGLDLAIKRMRQLDQALAVRAGTVQKALEQGRVRLVAAVEETNSPSLVVKLPLGNVLEMIQAFNEALELPPYVPPWERAAEALAETLQPAGLDEAFSQG